MNINKINDKLKLKQYALIRVGEKQLLTLYDSFGATEKEFRAYLEENDKAFKNGKVEYYALREDNKYIAQVTLMHEYSKIEDATIDKKRIYFNHFSILKNRSGLGFETLFLELIISKLNEKLRNKPSIFEYTISIGSREKKFRKILEDAKFKEYSEYINVDTNRKEILMLRKDKEL